GPRRRRRSGGPRRGARDAREAVAREARQPPWKRDGTEDTRPGLCEGRAAHATGLPWYHAAARLPDESRTVHDPCLDRWRRPGQLAHGFTRGTSPRPAEGVGDQHLVPRLDWVRRQ